MENKIEPIEGFEPYILSVHFKNIAPNEWFKSEQALDFLRKLEQYETDKSMIFEDLQENTMFMQQALDAQKCIKCGKALLQDGGGWLHGNAKIFMTQPEMTGSERWNEKSIKIEDFEISAHLCYECVDKLKLYKETPNKEFNI
jgi:hypothetical protein